MENIVVHKTVNICLSRAKISRHPRIKPKRRGFWMWYHFEYIFNVCCCRVNCVYFANWLYGLGLAGVWCARRQSSSSPERKAHTQITAKDASFFVRNVATSKFMFIFVTEKHSSNRKIAHTHTHTYSWCVIKHKIPSYNIHVNFHHNLRDIEIHHIHRHKVI